MVKRIKPIACLCLFLVFLYPATAQQVQGKDFMTELAESMHEPWASDGWVTDEQIRETDPFTFIQILAPYLIDESKAVRSIAYATLPRIFQVHDTPNVRRAVTDRLVAGLGNPVSEVQDAIHARIINLLIRDFTPQAKQKLRQLAHSTSPPSWTYLRFLGVAGIIEEIPFLHSLLGPGQNIYGSEDFDVWNGTLEFSALQVLARLGDDRAARRIVQLLDSIPTVDPRMPTLYLTYTLHPIAVEYIVENILSSDATVNLGIDID